ncbi:MAG: GGDEF domain-containing protein, partial [Thermoleophilia bacterium]|nr:GGDEF domain-containing protein [Thermoleophilia bacterium]
MEKNGVKRHFSLSTSAVTTRRGQPLGRAVVIHDITEKVRLLEQARELANHDDLTGLANRRHFLGLAVRELERSRRYGSALSLIFFDVDHFKEINDTFGHRAGDLVLQKLALVCRSALRQSDILGRLGGEEFAVLLPETALEEAAEVAERLRATIASMDLRIVGSGSCIRV